MQVPQYGHIEKTRRGELRKIPCRAASGNVAKRKRFPVLISFSIFTLSFRPVYCKEQEFQIPDDFQISREDISHGRGFEEIAGSAALNGPRSDGKLNPVH